jgi:DNA-binding transcriptional LysR family regulator
MNYTLSQLVIYCEVVKCGSVSQASEILNLTQPAVSIQLKNFQSQFPNPLIDVVGRKMHVTPLGWEVAEIAKSVIAEAQKLNVWNRKLEGKLLGELKFESVSTGKYVLPFFIAPFFLEHDAVEYKIDVTNKTKVIERIKSNQIDFALVSILPPNMKVQSIPILENKLYLVGSKQVAKSLSKQLKVGLKEWKVPFIYREQGSGTRQMMEKVLRKEKIQISKRIELTSNEAVKQALLANMGVSVMPLIGIRNELENGQLQILNCKGFPIETKWQIIWPKGKKLSHVAEAFLSFVRQNKANLAHTHFKWLEDFSI